MDNREGFKHRRFFIVIDCNFVNCLINRVLDFEIYASDLWKSRQVDPETMSASTPAEGLNLCGKPQGGSNVEGRSQCGREL